eukprot:gene596-325_t
MYVSIFIRGWESSKWNRGRSGGTMVKIYTVTFNPALDYVVGVTGKDGLQLGGINRTAYESLHAGGKGINVSWILKNLGVTSSALGFVAGFVGREIIRAVQAHGIEPCFVELEKGMTRINVKVKSATEHGDDTEINGQGPDIPPEALEALLHRLDTTLCDGDVLVISGSIPSSLPNNVYEMIMERFTRDDTTHRQVHIVVDATKDLLKKVLRFRPFLVKPNADELADLFQLPEGTVLKTDEEIIHYAKELQKLGARHVLVSMAGAGSLLVDERGKHVIRMGVPTGAKSNGGVPRQLRSSVGAGDSMVAGFLAGYFFSSSSTKASAAEEEEEEKGQRLKEALLLGTAAGSATAFSVGLADRELVDALLEELKESYPGELWLVKKKLQGKGTEKRRGKSFSSQSLLGGWQFVLVLPSALMEREYRYTCSVSMAYSHVYIYIYIFFFSIRFVGLLSNSFVWRLFLFRREGGQRGAWPAQPPYPSPVAFDDLHLPRSEARRTGVNNSALGGRCRCLRLRTSLSPLLYFCLCGTRKAIEIQKKKLALHTRISLPSSFARRTKRALYLQSSLELDTATLRRRTILHDSSASRLTSTATSPTHLQQQADIIILFDSTPLTDLSDYCWGFRFHQSISSLYGPPRPIRFSQILLPTARTRARTVEQIYMARHAHAASSPRGVPPVAQANTGSGGSPSPLCVPTAQGPTPLAATVSLQLLQAAGNPNHHPHRPRRLPSPFHSPSSTTAPAVASGPHQPSLTRPIARPGDPNAGPGRGGIGHPPPSAASTDPPSSSNTLGTASSLTSMLLEESSGARAPSASGRGARRTAVRFRAFSEGNHKPVTPIDAAQAANGGEHQHHQGAVGPSGDSSNGVGFLCRVFLQLHPRTRPPWEGHPGTGTTLPPRAAAAAASRQLDPSQHAAAHHDSEQPLLIEAGPGSGKTQTIVFRLAHLLNQPHIRPQQVLVLCFTRQAAEALRQRLQLVLSTQEHSGAGGAGAASLVKLKTMHAFGLECLRRFRVIDADTEVLDASKQYRLARRLVEEHALHVKGQEGIEGLLDYSSKVKRSSKWSQGQALLAERYQVLTGQQQQEQMRSPNATPSSVGAGVPGGYYPPEKQDAHLFALYQQALKEEHAVDFDDLQHIFYQLLRPVVVAQDEAEKEELQAEITHILVDEFQDLNDIQFEILTQLAGEACRVTCVGNPHQCIYGWRGALPDIFKLWKQRFPQTALCALALNYRSTPALVEMSNAFVPGRTQRSSTAPQQATKEEEGAEAKRCGLVIECDVECPVPRGAAGLPDEMLASYTRPVCLVARHVVEHILRSPAPPAPIAATRVQQPLPPPAGEPEQVQPALYYPRRTPLAYGDIAVLCRTRRTVKEMVQFFSEHRIPVQELKTTPGQGGSTLLAFAHSLVAYLRCCLHTPSNEDVQTALTQSPAPSRLPERQQKVFFYSLQATSAARRAAQQQQQQPQPQRGADRLLPSEGVGGRAPFFTPVASCHKEAQGHLPGVAFGREGRNAAAEGPDSLSSFYSILQHAVYVQFSPEQLPKLKVTKPTQKILLRFVQCTAYARDVLYRSPPTPLTCTAGEGGGGGGTASWDSSTATPSHPSNPALQWARRSLHFAMSTVREVLQYVVVEGGFDADAASNVLVRGNAGNKKKGGKRPRAEEAEASNPRPSPAARAGAVSSSAALVAEVSSALSTAPVGIPGGGGGGTAATASVRQDDEVEEEQICITRKLMEICESVGAAIQAELEAEVEKYQQRWRQPQTSITPPRGFRGIGVKAEEEEVEEVKFWQQPSAPGADGMAGDDSPGLRFFPPPSLLAPSPDLILSRILDDFSDFAVSMEEAGGTAGQRLAHHNNNNKEEEAEAEAGAGPARLWRRRVSTTRQGDHWDSPQREGVGVAGGDPAPLLDGGERRVFYVAITRAKTDLFFLTVPQVSRRCSTAPGDPTKRQSQPQRAGEANGHQTSHQIPEHSGGAASVRRAASATGGRHLLPSSTSNSTHGECQQSSGGFQRSPFLKELAPHLLTVHFEALQQQQLEAAARWSLTSLGVRAALLWRCGVGKSYFWRISSSIGFLSFFPPYLVFLRCYQKYQEYLFVIIFAFFLAYRPLYKYFWFKREYQKAPAHIQGWLVSLLYFFKALLAGSGAAFFGTKEGAEKLLSMTGAFTPGTDERVTRHVSIAYIGTATYDLEPPARQQLTRFMERGCEVVSIAVADPGLPRVKPEDEAYIRDEADILLVSGGNTLYAIRRWEETGLADVMRERITAPTPSKPIILAGGSAGAICWFTSGHSDSADPSTYLKSSIYTAAGRASELDEESRSTSWSYIRVHGMDLIPGMLCPHYDTTQSNGIPRREDFEKMLKRHPSERGIAIDHWAALVLRGDGDYEVYSVPGKAKENADSLLDEGVPPGVYILDVGDKGKLKITTIPREGRVDDIIRPPNGPVVKDPFEAFYAMANSTPSSGSFPKR